MKINRTKSASAFVLLICLLLTSLPTSYLADVIEDDRAPVATVGAGAPGVYEFAEDAVVIEVSTVEDLLALAQNCRINSWSVGKIVVLKNDIDLTGTAFSGIPTFGGLFVGQGYTIKGLNITEKGSVAGFFRYLQETAVVDGVRLEGKVTPEGSKSVVGGFVGENAGTLKNCIFSGEVSGYEQIGGLAGRNTETGKVEYCTVIGSVHGGHFVGGIIGENKGTIEKCLNEAEINTKALQNSVEMEDITVDNMLNTESANTATDIGGIVGINHAFVLACVNNGNVGYKNMGYNVGGIAGSQRGFMTECTNNANISGRKEVGGIVGHMEPYIVLEFETDGLQRLEAQLSKLGDLIKELRKTLNKWGEKLNVELEKLEKDVSKMEAASDVLAEELDFEEIEKELENSKENEKDSLFEDYENLEKMLERLEKVDWDRVSQAITDLTSASSDAVERMSNISQILNDTSNEAGPQVDAIVEQLEVIVDTIAEIEDNMGFSVEDISDKDTEEDKMGKVSYCVNQGKVSAEVNVGGIAGLLSDETDLDTREDIETTGEESLHGTYKLRVVVRNCTNYATVAASKQKVGGIAGQLMIGAAMDSCNMGNIDALKANYVGGIAGQSYGTIRSCSSKSILAGGVCVGGIAGEATKIEKCYAFISIVASSEKKGAIVGDTENLPKGTEEDTIVENFYFVPGVDIGGIDSISYKGATENLGLEEFLLLPELPTGFQNVSLKFIAEEGNQVFTIPVGTNFESNQIPTLSVEQTEEYTWKYIPQVTERILGMNETEVVEYISEERLMNILFNQTYEAVYEIKTSVIKSELTSDNKLALLLAEGIFAKQTTLTMEAEEDMESFAENWKVTFSNPGVSRLHYLIPSNMNHSVIKLYVKNSEGNWIEREFTVDGSYMIFDFTDADVNFALVEDYTELSNMITWIVIGIVGLIVAISVVRLVLKSKRKK